ncbi:MAG: hypothetical protein ABR536_05855, partial [Solirubrobacterales bacterium]
MDSAAAARVAERVMVVQTLGSPHPDRRKRLRPRRTKTVDSPPAIPDVPLTRVTVTTGTSFADQAEAQRWLKEIAADPERRLERLREALAILNRGLGALRGAAEDPLVHDVSLSAALSMRLGYGSGDQLADGRWTEARELPPAPSPRHADLDAQRRAALELAGV